MTKSNIDDFVVGTFLTELKNRFLCEVKINNKNVICYIPSSCRISNFIDMKDKEVLLRPIKTNGARTPYSVYAVKYRGHFIMLNLAEANRIIESQIRRRYFSFLGKRKQVTHEYKIGGYKADLFVHDTSTLIEIKSILNFSKMAIFPTVYSERSVRQLNDIALLMDKGYNACYIFVSLNQSVKEITINKEIKDYYAAFFKCVKKGMHYYAVSIRLNETTPEIYSKVKVNI